MNLSADKSKKVIDFDIGNKVVISSSKFYFAICVFSIIFITLSGLTFYTISEWNKFRSNINSYVNTSVSDSKEYVGLNVKNINERLATLEKLVEPISVLDPAYSIDETLRKLNTEVWKVNESRFSQVEGKVESMQLELAKAREKLQGSDKREVIYISLINLINKIRTSDPFEAELKSVANAAGKDANLIEKLNIIQPYSKDGVPSIHQLSGRFTEIGFKIVKNYQEAQNPEGQKFYERVYDKVASSVKIRKTGYSDGGDIESVVARAEALLKKSDIDGAITEVKKIEGKNNPDLQAWLKQAEAIKDTDRALSLIIGYLGNNVQQALEFKHEAKRDS